MGLFNGTNPFIGALPFRSPTEAVRLVFECDRFATINVKQTACLTILPLSDELVKRRFDTRRGPYELIVSHRCWFVSGYCKISLIPFYNK